jgi:pimeloyl-ACP methyl ester carboxylesterase
MEQFEAIRTTHDLIIADQRGTGESNPLMCEFPTVRIATTALLTLQWPDSIVDRCRAESEARGDLAQYTTTAAVADYDALRKAFGLRQVDVYGASYGTRIAQEYARRYPGSIRTLTLRAVVPPSAILFRDAEHTIQRAIERLEAECEADFKCAWSRGDLSKRLDDMVGRLNAHPGTISALGARGDLDRQIPFSGQLFLGAIRRMLSNEEWWPRTPNAIVRAIKDNLSGVAPAIGSAMNLERTQAQGVYWAITCAEDVPRVNADSARAAKSAGKTRNEFAMNALAVCARWGRAPVPADFADPLLLTAPVLVLSGLHDPITPPEFGTEVARHLPNGRHLVFQATSHTPFNSCQQRIVAEFIRDMRTQALDTTCMATLRRSDFTYRRWWWLPATW